MSQRFNPRWIMGKTIERVEMNPFPMRELPRGGVAYHPVLYFTDGSTLKFDVQESDSWEYGVALVYTPSKQ